ncbi:MAG: sugar transferase [Planctomycetota bacterium]
MFFTDKYVHKYPQRYYTYLIASHIKAAIIMAWFLWIMGMIAGSFGAPHDVLWAGLAFFVFADAFISVPHRRDIPNKEVSEVVSSPCVENTADTGSDHSASAGAGSASIDLRAAVDQIRPDLDKEIVELIEKNVPDSRGGTGGVKVLDDLTTMKDQFKSDPVHLLIGRTRINDVLRLNRFLQFCTKSIVMGGYLVVRYVPIENAAKDLKRRYKGVFYWVAYIFHFMWYRAFPKIPWLHKVYFSSKMSWLDSLFLSLTNGRNRVLSRAEVWGRLAFCGMDVVAELAGDEETFVLAQRVSFRIEGRKPTYYLIAALEKIGLDGKVIRAHKIRTMFPFSEFIQKRLFEEHGLTASGKFARDFRLTKFGKFLRRYWLDELPQIFDWMRGDIKLVGIRATSRHFLSLYPREFYDLYVQIKPGLIPPVFDESIETFDQIVEVEHTYLKSYRQHPIRTDVRYFLQTFTDIVFKGVRSK